MLESLIALIILILVVVIAFVSRFKTVGTEEAAIITGSALFGGNVVTSSSGGRVKIVKGGGYFHIPVIQKAQILSLRNMMLDVRAINVYSSSKIRVTVDGTVILKVGSTNEAIMTSAEQFLGQEAHILTNSKEITEGHLRSIISSMAPEEINGDREKFQQEVQKVVATDLRKMGLEIISFNIKEITDADQYFVSLGKKRSAEVKREAETAVAENESTTRISVAQREKEAREAEIAKEVDIANYEKERDLKVSAFKIEQDKARAQADQAYDLEEAKLEQEVMAEKMKVSIIERTKQVELEQREVERRDQLYQSEIVNKSIAERSAREQQSEAAKLEQQRRAEAEAYEVEQQARANLATGRAEAEVITARGKAEADAVEFKMMAEAKGILEKGLAEAKAREELAIALEKLGEAGVIDLVIRALPEIAREISAPMANVSSISIVDTGGSDSDGVSKLSKSVLNNMVTLPEAVKSATGVDLLNMLEKMSKNRD